MSSFSIETYKNIRGSAPKDLRTGNWYEATYDSYIQILEDNKLDRGSEGFYNSDDFLIAASFAFSWLARIPTLKKPMFDLDKPVDIIYHLNQIDNKVYNAEMDEKMISELVSKLDNSVVAVSKMLHFLSPNYFPIVDAKVIESWNILFPEHRLPKKIDIERYLHYSHLMRDWSAKTGITLRELEKALFEFKSN